MQHQPGGKEEAWAPTYPADAASTQHALRTQVSHVTVSILHSADVAAVPGAPTWTKLHTSTRPPTSRRESPHIRRELPPEVRCPERTEHENPTQSYPVLPPARQASQKSS